MHITHWPNIHWRINSENSVISNKDAALCIFSVHFVYLMMLAGKDLATLNKFISKVCVLSTTMLR